MAYGRPCLVLVGFMGAGKSSVGALLARRLGWRFVDLDDEVQTLAGESIRAIFARRGEEGFRALEERAASRLAGAAPAGQGMVVAAGGGSLERQATREALQRLGRWVWLFADLPESLRRARQEGDQRPLLAGPEGEAGLQRRFARRRWQYARADVWVDTRDVTPEQVVERVLQAEAVVAGQPTAGWVLDGPRSHPLFAGPGLLGEVPELARRVGLGGALWLVCDRAVADDLGRRLLEALVREGRPAARAALGPGERAKRLRAVAELYTRAVEVGVDRGWGVLGVGGGAVLDAAGFVAATYMRGLPWVAVPTTLLAQVDASVGGKTAVNHPRAKNLIGAFHLPRAVLADSGCLATLPTRELRSGMAELVKHALVGDPDLLEALEGRCQGLSRGRLSGVQLRELLEDAALIRWAARVKAVVVSQDPYEAGERAILNLGHTTAHALEAVSGFRLRHGEAVAIGLMTALELSARTGLLEDRDLPRRVQELLWRLGLPTACRGRVPPAGALWEAMAHDKKNRRASRRWVLLERVGQATVVGDRVEQALFEEVWEGQHRSCGLAAGPPDRAAVEEAGRW